MNRIRYYRLAKGLTMAELGKRVDCSEASISYYELGKREAKYETLLKIAEALDTTVDSLLGNNHLLNSESNFSSPDIKYSSGSIVSSLSQLSDNQLDDLFVQMISGRDKDYLLRLASKILEIASQK